MGIAIFCRPNELSFPGLLVVSAVWIQERKQIRMSDFFIFVDCLYSILSLVVSAVSGA